MRDKKLDICIVGPGAVGILFAVLLSKVRRVALLVRPEHMEAMRSGTPTVSGHIREVAGDLTVVSNVETISCKSYWLCVKSYALPSAVAAIDAPRRRDGSSVICASNGFGAHEELRGLLPEAPLVRLMCGFGVRLAAPGETRLAGPLSAVCAGSDGDLEARHDTALALREIGCDCVEDDDPRRAEWRKSLVNVPVNTICSILDAENGVILSDPALRTTAARLVEEVLSAAAKDGRPLEIPADTALESVRAHASNINSTLSDMRSKKRTEADEIVGRVIAAGNAAGADMRLTSAMFALLKARERMLGCA